MSSPVFLLPYVLLVCLLDNVLPWVCLKGPSTPLDREFAPLLPRCKGPWQGLYTLYRASLQKEKNNKTPDSIDTSANNGFLWKKRNTLDENTFTARTISDRLAKLSQPRLKSKLTQNYTNLTTTINP